MSFLGWYKDAMFTQPVSASDKYEVDTVLYAKWTEMSACKDGSFNHQWGFWEDDAMPTCTKAGTQVQFCDKCGAKNTKEGDPALGHNWRPWTEGFLRRERVCAKAGCGVEQYQEFENITLSTLGNTPASQVKLQMGAGWGADRAACVVNGTWDEANSGTFCGNACEVKVTITLLTPAMMDRVYVKGHGGASGFNIYVQYEGDSDYTLVGSGSFLSDAANSDKDNRVIPYAAIDNTRNVVSVQVIMPTSSQGYDYWDEIAFVKIPPVEN